VIPPTVDHRRLSTSTEDAIQLSKGPLLVHGREMVDCMQRDDPLERVSRKGQSRDVTYYEEPVIPDPLARLQERSMGQVKTKSKAESP